MRGELVKITKKENLKLGELHNCHFNAAEYAIENNCKFVCGWVNGNPHCICEKDGEYIDPTFNQERYFKIFHTYTAYEICNIFNKEGYAFIPFIGNYGSVYDGMRKLKDDEIEEWFDYIYKMQFE